MAERDASPMEMAREYDRAAEETGWFGPEVAFGLAFAFVAPGESLLDIGIGTGLTAALFHKAGLRVFGMDISPVMLEICRMKEVAADLRQHDLTVVPYPYAPASMDHVTCTGVLHFFADPRPLFGEVARIGRPGGVFAFSVGDRAPDEAGWFEVGPEHTGDGVTMYRHGQGMIGDLLEMNGFVALRALGFSLPLDPERRRSQVIRTYVARKRGGADRAG